MRLFHISEENNIHTFTPRTSIRQWGNKKYVWAISEMMVHNYLFPRNCPRICVQSPDVNKVTSLLEIEVPASCKALIFIPTSWEEKVRSTPLFRYEFANDQFKCIDSIAGYYVSESIQRPIAKEPIKDSASMLQTMGVKVISEEIDTLEDIKDIVANQLKHFSVIRWNHISLKNTSKHETT